MRPQHMGSVINTTMQSYSTLLGLFKLQFTCLGEHDFAHIYALLFLPLTLAVALHPRFE
jgi:hypothetical protein